MKTTTTNRAGYTTRHTFKIDWTGQVFELFADSTDYSGYVLVDGDIAYFKNNSDAYFELWDAFKYEEASRVRAWHKALKAEAEAEAAAEAVAVTPEAARDADIAAVEEALNVSISNVSVFHHENALDYSCDARKYDAEAGYTLTYSVVKAKDETLLAAVKRATRNA